MNTDSDKTKDKIIEEKSKNKADSVTVPTEITSAEVDEKIKFEFIGGLLSILETSGKSYNIDKIKAAYLYAEELHSGQIRMSGEAYIWHPIAVAEIVAILGLDSDSVVAAFLHDTVEDCPDKTNIGEIKARFGEDVAVLVGGLTKMADLNIEDKEEIHMENIRKMLLAMSKDIRVIFIKLCDRLHNMRTLGVKVEDKRRTTALETMHVYAPLAHRLGMQRMKQELENLALQYLDPIGYAEVSSDIDKKFGQNQNFIENVKNDISEKMREYEIRFSLEGRVKTVYSIYRKMYNQNKNFDEIYDFYALRIIVGTETECYTALGVIHEMYKSIPGRFKDYISTPKPNMYQSLHTTVIGRDGIPFEVQIRTKEMHNIAEYGVAAHWKYKTGEKNNKEDIDKKLSWIARLIETEDGTIDFDDFMHALKVDIFQDEVFVFTPKGDVITLPMGASLIDFAYAIHSEVGNKMVGAKINGSIAPIDRSPQNGEIVQVLTSPLSKGPKRDWLNVVKTSEARNKIRQWFKKEKRTENIVVGKGEISREFAKYPRACTEAEKHEIVTTIARRLGIQEADDLYSTIGYGGISLAKVFGKLRDEYDRYVKTVADEPEIIEAEDVPTVSNKRLKSSSGIIIDGTSGCAVKFAKCCNPLPGDDIIGFSTKGYGISIHKRDCPNVLSSMKTGENIDRWKNADWDTEEDESSGKGMYEAIIQIFAENNITLIAEISHNLAEMKVAITSMTTKSKNDKNVIINMTIGCRDKEHFNLIVTKLKSIQRITDVARGFN